jgi:hypothetical protein
MNAILTVIITEARSNVGNFSRGGGEWVSGRTPFIHPQYFLNYGYILWSKTTKLSSEKVSTEHPQKMHSWMYTFSSIVLLHVETVLSALMNK